MNDNHWVLNVYWVPVVAPAAPVSAAGHGAPLHPPCLPYVAPVFEPTPGAPLKEFQQLRPGEEAKQVALLLGYIEKLRHHISQIKRQSAASHAEYVQRCPGA